MDRFSYNALTFVLSLCVMAAYGVSTWISRYPSMESGGWAVFLGVCLLASVAFGWMLVARLRYLGWHLVLLVPVAWAVWGAAALAWRWPAFGPPWLVPVCVIYSALLSLVLEGWPDRKEL